MLTVVSPLIRFVRSAMSRRATGGRRLASGWFSRLVRKVWFVWLGVDKPEDERLLRDERKQLKLFPRKRDAEKAARECAGRVVAQWVGDA